MGREVRELWPDILHTPGSSPAARLRLASVRLPAAARGASQAHHQPLHQPLACSKPRLHPAQGHAAAVAPGPAGIVSGAAAAAAAAAACWEQVCSANRDLQLGRCHQPRLEVGVTRQALESKAAGGHAPATHRLPELAGGHQLQRPPPAPADQGQHMALRIAAGQAAVAAAAVPGAQNVASN